MDGDLIATGAMPVVFAACDERYFKTHGKGFCASGLAAGHRVHIIISPEPGPDLADRAAALRDKIVSKFTASIIGSDRANLTIEVVADKRAHQILSPLERKVFYQSLRFYYLPELLRRYNTPIVTLDIDSLIRLPIPSRSGRELGIYFRLDNTEAWSDESLLGKKVLAAMIYATPYGADFFDKVMAYLDKNDRRYFVDQRAIYEVYLQEPPERFFDLAETGWLDWTFRPDAPVWTAKGRLLRREMKYVRERLRHEGRGAIRSALALTGYKLGILRR